MLFYASFAILTENHTGFCRGAMNKKELGLFGVDVVY